VKSDPYAMRSTFGGRLLTRWYGRVPMSSLMLRTVVKREGGEMFSTTLRQILKRHYGVEVGAYSYGGLLKPGFADTQTVIGRYVSIGSNVRRIGAAHPLDSVTMHPFWYNPRLGFVTAERDVVRTGIEIGHDSWVGTNVTILPKCRRIGIGAVVGAGSVVTKDVPDFAIVVGNPAKVIGHRFDQAAQDNLLTNKPWELEPQQMSAFIASLPLQAHSPSDQPRL
jgi:virginiamycin A acetyltransferase